MKSDGRQIANSLPSSHGIRKLIMSCIPLHEALAAERVDQSQGNDAICCVPPRKIAYVCRCGKANTSTDLSVKRDHIDAIPHLRHAVMNGIYKGIIRLVAHSIECLDDLLHDIMAAIIQD